MQRLNFILALCILGSTSVFAQDEDAQTVTATGFGAILSGDRAKARDDAIQNALREAIQQVVGQMITSETVVENFTLLSDRVYSKTNGYIRTHKVIDEKSHPDEIEITVEAVVMQGSLENDLMGIDELLDRLRHPRIMVIIDEQVVITGSDSTALPVTNTAEAAIRESLLAKGFDVVDYKTIQQNLKRDQTIAASRGDATAAMALGRQYEAEVVITGRATATQAQLSESLAKILGSMKSF